MKIRYKFLGRTDGFYVWESVTTIGPGESRHEQIRANIAWFWNPTPREQ